LTGTTTVAATAGVANFAGLRIAQSGRGYRLVATAGSLTASSPTFNVAVAGPDAAQSLLESAASETAADGRQILPLTIRLRDASGQPVEGVAGSRIQLTAQPATGATFGLPSGVSGSAGLLTAGFRTTSLGPVTLTALLDGLPLAGTVTVTGVTGPPAQVGFVTVPEAVTQGVGLEAVEVELQDATGRRSPGSLAVTVALTTPGGASLGGTTSVAASAGLARFTDLVIDRAGSYTLTATATGATAAVSGPLAVRGPTRIGLSGRLADTASGQRLGPLTVTLLDATGVAVPNATKTVRMGLSGGAAAAVLEGTTEVAAVGGVATFDDLAIDLVGSGYTLTAAGDGLTPVTSAAFAVVAGPADELRFATVPTAVTQGRVLGPVTVNVYDSGGNLSTGATTVTLSLTAPGEARLSGTTSVAVAAGRARFDTLVIDRAGSYRLQASANGLPAVVSEPVLVRGPAQLAFVQPPSHAQATENMLPVAVEIQDSTGVRVPNAVNAVRLTLSGGVPGAVLGGVTEVSAAGGLASFSTLRIESSALGYALTASAAGLSGVTSPLFDVADGPPAQLVFAGAPTQGIAGAPWLR